MSLDISLYAAEPQSVTKKGTGVFARKDGQTIELSADEVKERWPDAKVEEQEYTTDEVYSANITHNLTKMADEAGIYYALWRPEEKGYMVAGDIIPALEYGLNELKASPDRFEKLGPDNGWGTYNGLVATVEEYLQACKQYPDAVIEVSR